MGKITREELAEVLTNELDGNLNSINGINTQLADIAVNIKNFGAKGDSVTDDTLAFKNAVKYCIDNRKKGKALPLVIPTGDYLITDTISIVPMTIFSTGIAKIKFQPSSSKEFIHIDKIYEGSTNVLYGNLDDISANNGQLNHHISNLQIECTNSNGTIGINLSGSMQYCEISNIRVSNFNIGINAFFTFVVSLYDVHCIGCQKGIVIDTSNDMKVENSECSNGGYGIYITCSLIDGSTTLSYTINNFFKNNTFQNNTKSGYIAVKNDASIPGERMSGIHIDGGYYEFTATGQTAIQTTLNTSAPTTDYYDIGEFYDIYGLSVKNITIIQGTHYAIKTYGCSNVNVDNINNIQNTNFVVYFSNSNIDKANAKIYVNNSRAYVASNCTFNDNYLYPIYSLNTGDFFNKSQVNYAFPQNYIHFTRPIEIRAKKGFDKLSFYATAPLLINSKVGIVMCKIETDGVDTMSGVQYTSLVTVTSDMVTATASATESNPVKITLNTILNNFIPGMYMIGICCASSNGIFTGILAQNVSSRRQWLPDILGQSSMPVVDDREYYLEDSLYIPVILLETTRTLSY